MLHPKDLKMGDVFYECQSGLNFQYTMVEEPVQTTCKDGAIQWSWKAENKSGAVADFLLTEGFECYGPRIYDQPQYCKIVNGEMDFEVL